MTVRLLRSAETRFLSNDNRISSAEADQLVQITADFGGVSPGERRELTAMLSRDLMDAGARAKIEALLNQVTPPPTPSGSVVRQQLGTNSGQLTDDQLFFGRDGSVSSQAGITPYTRSYDAIKQGPLRQRHGSRAPESIALSSTELSALRAQSPGASLDKAARLFGFQDAAFEAMATSPEFFDEKAEDWWGKCHAWSWSALDNWVNSHVDVEGPPGQQGVWLGGQWLSRADLGNWMMAVADKISLNSSNVLFDSQLSADDLLKGIRQYMMENGGGVVADVHNDAKEGSREVWNQPFSGGSMDVRTLSGSAAQGVLDVARRDGVTGGTQVKLVKAVGTYGVEISDSHEGAPGRATKTWNVYAVTDSSGKMLKAYEADNAALRSVTGLPTRETDNIPEYFWKPRMDAVADVLAGRPNAVVDRDNNGREFRFFVEKFLKSGVPGTTRSAFEAKIRALPSGPLSSATVAQLRTDFAGVANAYSPQQWERTFGSRGLRSADFGAAWR